LILPESQRQVTLGLKENNSILMEISISSALLMVYGSAAQAMNNFRWKSLDPSIATVGTTSDSETLSIQISAVREGETKIVGTNAITGQTVFIRVIVTDGVTYPQLMLGDDTSFALKKD